MRRVNPLTALAVRIGRLPWLPRYARYIVGLDRGLQRLTRGRVSVVEIAGLRELVLTTTGRRSGRPRETPLLYVPHGEDYLVAGSNWGGDRLPAWVHNLRAQPEVTVTVRGRRQPVRAREVTGAEREGLWRHMLRTWPNFATYAERTDREIPVFVLSRR
jgi:deazaflavin-dependent oxidoreductase (nitroreductase family)